MCKGTDLTEDVEPEVSRPKRRRRSHKVQETDQLEAEGPILEKEGPAQSEELPEQKSVA